MMKEYRINKVKVAGKGVLSICLFALIPLMTACDDFLDKLPDNRMELKTPSDIKELLVSAYPANHPAYLLEMYSDNTDECINPQWAEADRFQRQAYNWDDITETGQDESPQELWNRHYRSIASANIAIDFIEEQNDKALYTELLGEALLCRAYAMFQLSTVFCNAYNPATASSEKGLPYPEHAEKVVGAKFDRGTLAELYDKIDADIQRGLPLVSNSYDRPKFHFTPDAANAFAARFYLYKGDFAKAISHASKVLGSNPAIKARNWDYYYSLNPNGDIRPEAYINANEKANLMLQVVYSEWGAIYGPYRYGDRYAHSSRICDDEDIRSMGPWGASGNVFKTSVWSNNALAKLFHAKIPYEFEYTDPQAGIGYAHSEFAVFTTEILLIERAEAYALSKNLNAAVNDLNTLLSIWMIAPTTLTLDDIVAFYNKVKYYEPKSATPKKHFVKPVYAIDAEGSDQESLLQCILHLKRILTVHEGFRMQDVKRYGIEIYRRQTNTSFTISDVTDTMTADDPRRAIQLPKDVISAGLEGNDRRVVQDLGESQYLDQSYLFKK